MKQFIYLVRRECVTREHQPRDPASLIERREIVRKTLLGYRLKYPNSDHTSIYLDTHYCFFEAEPAALGYVVQRANIIAAELEGRKLAAVRLMCKAQDALKALTSCNS